MLVQAVPEGGNVIGFIDEEPVSREALVPKIQQVILDESCGENAGSREAILAVPITGTRG